ncbi:uncharacterized protein PGTG_13135 [Puccinia graminis f. sp. tritici CRL 75-36-700-3]|uniref:Uncharacterized protein n=1 Tax=Puccinia graminis f. sp. tritici (strain CRL 75-36-700-3 / race SCCL) TaxID=418459 RepID=E3KR28_PUCGT|nr:uncharacterized protein PGTG_13135 [Puccinia graminis f. sp. tritici CRL 75-36-700-3]EFP86753.2 hypothetical protein PGTG_13135 [Puccinia graminis f. sp. tritici CRL 75-36-700-3]
MAGSSGNAIQIGKKPLKDLISGTRRQQSSFGRVSLPIPPERLQAEDTVKEMSLDMYIQATRNAFDIDGRYHGILMNHLTSHLPFIGRNGSIPGNWLDHLVRFTLEVFPSEAQISGVPVDEYLNPHQWQKTTQNFLSMILNN